MNNEVFIIFIDLFIVISLIFLIYSNNLIFALLFLILSFIMVFFVLLLLDCEFLAFVILIVYIGAIVILFLFVLILLEIKFENLSKNLVTDFLVGYFFIFVILFFSINFKLNDLLFLRYQTIKPINFLNWKFLINYNYKIKTYSLILYTNFVLEFLVIGFVLLLVLIGIVFIINNYLSLNTKLQTNIKQVSIRSKFFY